MSKLIFWAQSIDGKQNMGSEYLRNKYADDLAKNPGARYKIERITPESRKQRGFFEGAVVPLVTYFQDRMDYKKSDDNRVVREWLKLEFNGDLKSINGKTHRIAKSTKGELNNGILDKIIDWVEENYGIDRMEVLNPDRYQRWIDEIFSFTDGPDHYIDYLVSINKLPAHEFSKKQQILEPSQ